ncbi:hypothetical protein CDL15_Pgr004713 [Punica granatum]|uniref:Uncharacterized protein n=1 Tax=Punica granatum TaxID=22663 RepID=A0A218W7Q2_PUNGR|nr:hypothetical protein CDL15_Pgr004713 [Punica granatum]
MQLKKMCKEGAAKKVPTGKNAMIGGVVTGLAISLASNNHKDKIVMDAITGSNIATATEFINYLTSQKLRTGTCL